MTATMDIKGDFGVYDVEPELVYLDSASTSLVPKVAVDATQKFLNSTVSSARRGAYRLAVDASSLAEDVRKSLADFNDTERSQISFQKSIPTAVASFAYGFDWKGTNRNKIVLAQSEEHSILVTLLRVAQILGLQVETVSLSSDGVLDLSGLDQAVDAETGIVAVSHVTVGAGVRNPLREVAKICQDHEALLLTDATRSMGVTDTTLSSLQADIAVCSANIGLMAPPGLALQWIRKDLGETYQPGVLGGSAVADVEAQSFEVALQPDKFESGTLNLPAIAGLGASLDYLRELRNQGQLKHMNALSAHTYDSLSDVKGLTLYGNSTKDNSIFGFNIGDNNGINCHEIALFLDDSNIAVRSGLVCAHPLIKPFSEEGLVQISLHAYNTREDIDRLAESLRMIIKELL
ncbi:MAG: aminotransferase class V-fold PLP-dependent enzyme [Candidatus Thorarchaeota archaeon]|jgi:cysteine desulfurase/selenocysteine lyase